MNAGEGAQACAALKTYPLGRFARRDHALRKVAGSSALVKVSASFVLVLRYGEAANGEEHADREHERIQFCLEAGWTTVEGRSALSCG